MFKLKVLLTGANGYIGTRLLHVLVEQGYQVVALVRSARRFNLLPHLEEFVEVVEGDLLELDTLDAVPLDVEAGYYLVHSMGNQAEGFSELEERCAQNFCSLAKRSEMKQIIYLSGLSDKSPYSEHMESRHRVEQVLRESQIPLTTLRAGVVIGSGSASFEIIRDLVEKLPVMVAPRWVTSYCQPIAIADVLFYLSGVLKNEKCLHQTFEIGSSDVLTYKNMLLQLARVRGLRRYILTVPVLTPRLSSLWLFFITSTNFSIARALVNSLKVDAVCSENKIQSILPHVCLSYSEALRKAFEKIEQNTVLSSWKDAIVNSHLPPNLKSFIEVPQRGCYKNIFTNTYAKSREDIMKRLWAIGGKRGWYYMDWAWSARGWVDKCMGGVGLRRGRTHSNRLDNGDALDFWRVILADQEEGHLLLYAEMKLPGEAWLEWEITELENGRTQIVQTATFRPRGLLGRLYWFVLIPVHMFIFRGLCNSLSK